MLFCLKTISRWTKCSPNWLCISSPKILMSSILVLVVTQSFFLILSHKRIHTSYPENPFFHVWLRTQWHSVCCPSHITMCRPRQISIVGLPWRKYSLCGDNVHCTGMVQFARGRMMKRRMMELTLMSNSIVSPRMGHTGRHTHMQLLYTSSTMCTLATASVTPYLHVQQVRVMTEKHYLSNR
jgi:hypothetical protein